MASNLNLDDIMFSLCEDLGYANGDATLLDAKVRHRLVRYVNEGYRHILSMSEFAPLRSITLPFVSEPNRKTYGFPSTFVQIDQMVDVTNNIRLRLMPQDMFRTIDPQEVSSGTPTHYVPTGLGPTMRDLLTPSGVWAVSNIAGDVGPGAKVAIYATTSNPAPSPGGSPAGLFYVSPLTGTTRVPVTPANVVAIQQIQAQGTTGTIQFWDAFTGGNLLAEVAAGQTSVQYQQFRLWPTPAGAYQYQVDGSCSIPDLSDHNFTFPDIPVIPADFQYVLCDYARMKDYEYRDDSRFALVQAQYTAKLKLMRDRIMDPPDYRPRVGRVPDRSSNLGSYFPPGRW